MLTPAIFDTLCQVDPTRTGPESVRVHDTVPGSQSSALLKSLR